MPQILRQVGLDPALELESDGTLVFEKQVAFAGDFVKVDANGEKRRFSLTPDVLDVLERDTNRMIEAGVRVPSPLQHSRSPEDNRGTWSKFYRKRDSKNREGLFGRFVPRDAKAAELAKTSDVSVWLLPDYTDGTNNKYDYVVRHVALTDYPVINSMDQFKQLAASEDAEVVISQNPENPDRSKNMKPIIAALSLELSEDVLKDEKKTEELVLAEVKRLVDDHKKSSESTKKLETELSEAKSQVKLLETKLADHKDVKTYDKLTLSLFRDNREGRIDRLVSDHKITPASARALKDTWCRESIMTRGLELSDDGKDELFETLLKTLSDREGLDLAEESGGQGKAELYELSEDDRKENYLLKDMDRRRSAS
jgi:hypothetical protein